MTDPAAPTPAGLDPVAVADFLAAVPQVAARPPLTAELIAGGLSNLTYEVRDADGRCWVLRRPPLGHVLPTAHDMRREYRVISALHGMGSGTRSEHGTEDGNGTRSEHGTEDGNGTGIPSENESRTPSQNGTGIPSENGTGIPSENGIRSGSGPGSTSGTRCGNGPEADTVPVARPYVLCEDTDVIGAPFYLMEKVDGVVLRTRAQCAQLTVAQRRSAGESLVDVLAALHRVDPAQVGLADFGRPEGYLHRQLDRWDRQYASSQSREIRGLFELGDGLRAAVPVTQRSAILHGDYRLDNVMMRLPENGGAAVAAVFDWEMSTLGDPLADLGLLLTYWEDPGHPSKGILAAAGGGLTNHEGFPNSRQIVDRYQAATGLIVDDLDWYIAFSHYKLAVILEGIHYRHEHGLTLGEGFERAGAAVPALVEVGRRYLDRTR